MHVTGLVLIGSILASLCVSPAISVPLGESTSTTQETLSLAPFNSIELDSGGKIFLRHGTAQRVTLLKGSRDYTSIVVSDRGQLVIEKCKVKCPKGYALEIEIVTSTIDAISVSNGGVIRSDSFPRQESISLAVSHGGVIDVRPLPVNSVSAAVEQGGRILVKPQTAMAASVNQGGEIMYWGNAKVVSSVSNGGAVTKGTADDAEKPLSDPGSSVPAVPAAKVDYHKFSLAALKDESR
jgi:hypothetical protein